MKDEIKDFMSRCRKVSDVLNLQRFLPRPEKVQFTLPISAWTAVGDKYFADILVTGVTENDDAEVDFDSQCLEIVSNAEIEGEGDSGSGYLRIYAKYIPMAQISGILSITKGVSS